jgi:diguanylate cyclase (GGDEF)-like protein
MIVDVDNFKAINDTMGHDGGDVLLRALAARLRAAVNPGDLVARTGGDEFAMIVAARGAVNWNRLRAYLRGIARTDPAWRPRAGMRRQHRSLLHPS